MSNKEVICDHCGEEITGITYTMVEPKGETWCLSCFDCEGADIVYEEE